jgi:hypothetical protein
MFAQLPLKWVLPSKRNWATMRIEVNVLLETPTSPIAGKRQATSPSCENDKTKGKKCQISALTGISLRFL